MVMMTRGLRRLRQVPGADKTAQLGLSGCSGGLDPLNPAQLRWHPQFWLRLGCAPCYVLPRSAMTKLLSLRIIERLITTSGSSGPCDVSRVHAWWVVLPRALSVVFVIIWALFHVRKHVNENGQHRMCSRCDKAVDVASDQGLSLLTREVGRHEYLLRILQISRSELGIGP